MARKKVILLLLPALTVGILVFFTFARASTEKIVVSAGGLACLECHEARSPALVNEWKISTHAQRGVDCYACHRADENDPDAMGHYGFTVSVLVTPQDCSRCHARQVKEMRDSSHAKAANVLNSPEGYLGEMQGGPQAMAPGCNQCHGSRVRVLSGGKLDPATWPNAGIGRINPDGSLGSCSACHARHAFSKAQARTPDACGRCHLGPAYPQMEVYQESMHGRLYAAVKERLNMGKKKWVVGEDYSAAPTCATCHMSATPRQQETHDVSARISWNLGPPLAERRPNADERRRNMDDVCSNCHSTPFVTGFTRQFDDLVDFTNEKFAKPMTAMRAELIDRGKLTSDNFDDKLDWTYFELWHRAGRRARQGAAMAAPNSVWWQGIYEVAKQFTTKFLPEVKEAAGPDLYRELAEKYLEPDAEHRLSDPFHRN